MKFFHLVILLFIIMNCKIYCNYDDINNYLVKQLNKLIYLENRYIEEDFNCLNINDLYSKNNLYNIYKNPKLYKKLIDKIVDRVANYFLNIKKIILNSENIENSSKNEIRISLDILEFYLLEKKEIKYPVTNIIDSTLQNLRNLIPSKKEYFNQLQNIFINLKMIYLDLKKSLELKNEIEALSYLKNLNLNDVKQINIQHILNIHKIILKDIDNENAGFWRKKPCIVLLSPTIFPSAIEIDDKMNEFIYWFKNNKEKNDVKLAADFHFKFVKIHPFVDGNGRIARLFMNFILINNGYTPFLLSKPESYFDDYYKYIESSEPLEFYHYLKKIVFKRES